MVIGETNGIFWSIFFRSYGFQNRSKGSDQFQFTSFGNQSRVDRYSPTIKIDPEIISALGTNYSEFGSTFPEYLLVPKDRNSAIEGVPCETNEIEKTNMKRRDKIPNRRDKELILANIVIWGSLVTALTLTISLAPAGATEDDRLGGSASDVM